MVFKDQELIAEAYNLVLEKKHKCMASQGCDCDGCAKCKANQKKKKISPAQKKIAKAAPPSDKITGADFKALKDVKEEISSFKALYNKVIAEEHDRTIRTISPEPKVPHLEQDRALLDFRRALAKVNTEEGMPWEEFKRKAADYLEPRNDEFNELASSYGKENIDTKTILDILKRDYRISLQIVGDKVVSVDDKDRLN